MFDDDDEYGLFVASPIPAILARYCEESTILLPRIILYPARKQRCVLFPCLDAFRCLLSTCQTDTVGLNPCDLPGARESRNAMQDLSLLPAVVGCDNPALLVHPTHILLSLDADGVPIFTHIRFFFAKLFLYRQWDLAGYTHSGEPKGLDDDVPLQHHLWRNMRAVTPSPLLKWAFHCYGIVTSAWQHLASLVHILALVVR